ncbi:AAA family ATPase [Streptomyces sp. NPDC048290]|uniref:ATP-binding protein n=1 Tax=Streptomyces sp. NPDC048290 TaxID=3155811 RepID=UPI003437CDCA
MLYGRTGAQDRLDELITGAMVGRSGAVLLRGEAGIGKTVLLDWLAERASGLGMRVLRVRGIEHEADLAFAGLLQLVWPVQQRLDALPEAQAHALRSVLGSGEHRGTDRFLTGLAVLTLLAELAEDGPLLCLVDDAQWLDQASAEALLFAARRLGAERIAMVLAGRDAAKEEEGPGLGGLSELRLSRLGPDDAARLLQSRGHAAALSSPVIAESLGNPLALIEFAAVRRDGHHHHTPLPVADRVLSCFRSQIARLPEPTRLMLLIVAAEARGDLRHQMRAAERLGVGFAELDPAETAGLVRMRDGVLSFRHPLIASATYQNAPLARRIAVHQALAEAAEDPDCRARHLVALTPEPDAAIAGELAAAGERARACAAYGAAARLYEHAARVSPGTTERAARLATAATLALTAGHSPLAGRLAGQAEQLPADPADRALLARVRAAVLVDDDDLRGAGRHLLDEARRTTAGDAPGLLVAAAQHGWLASDASLVRASAARLTSLDRQEPLAQGLAALCDGDYALALPTLTESLKRHLAALTDTADGAGHPREVRQLAATGAFAIGDDTAALALATADVARCRDEGLIGELPQALEALSQVQAVLGQHRDARAAIAEGKEIAGDTGQLHRLARLYGVEARLAAVEGDEEHCHRLVREAPRRSLGEIERALVLLDLGLGRYAAALERMAPPAHGPVRVGWLSTSVAADQIEAAVRLGTPEAVEGHVIALETWALSGGAPWTRAVAARCRALLSDRADDYARALRLHAEGGRPFEQARTELLYGEWLRRSRRRGEARDPLRSALAVFEALHAEPWVRRTRAELELTGETVSAAQATAQKLADRLTPQELQVVRLAAGGNSSRQIAAQLFLSPRTVEHHLYKAYPKLGVGSRRELAGLDLT